MLHIFKTVSHSSRGLILNIVTSKRREIERFSAIEIMYLPYLFLFRIALTEKYKKVKTIEDNFYHKVSEAKCSGNFKVKAVYTVFFSIKGSCAGPLVGQFLS